MDGVYMDEIAAFLSVLGTGSFVRGAKALGKDVSTVSRRVSALETRLAVRLMERSTRKLTPTEAGAALYERMTAATSAMEEGLLEVAQAGNIAKGLLRLALPATFGRMCIAPLLPEFLAGHPGVSIDVEFSDRYVDLMGERFDVAIRIGELQDSRLISRRLMTNERVLYASPAYLAAHGTPQRPDDLTQHVCVANSRFKGNPEWRLRKDAGVTAVRVNARYTADDPESLIAAAIAGVGIVAGARWLVARPVAQGSLVPVLPGWTFGTPGAIHLLLPSGRFMPGKARSFIDWLVTCVDDRPWAQG
ncbi:LysR family transcriptional regulator [Paraburkholderia sp. RL17-337-BIB-A]|uniref:LysR family transcriptional regulator n=1 Tax=Paraburkholderia sp. RL17-337-BIB-A TaxID=3031636 RepID=UPI0038BD7D84